MKKLLSLVLVLLMALTAAACSSTPGETAVPAEAPAVPAEAPAAPAAPAAAPEAPAEPEKAYTALGLCIKNKTGAVIDEVYIYPAGCDKGLSVVEKGWKDKSADKAGYEKNIYIVREAGAELELLVVFEDGTEASRPLGKLESYYEISLEDGKDPAAWEVELEEDADDRALMDAAVALGKTADNVYPGYELIAIELKNKTGKNIVDFRFYEEGGSAEAYNNIIDYLYTEAGEKMASLMPGKAKEGGMYLYKCFIRPHTDNYFVYVRFDDGTDITYPIEDWFKPDGDGHCPNEISLKNAEDKYDIKVQYDDGDPDPLAYLAESLAKGYVVDQWYPVYDGAPAADEAAEAARAELAKIPVPAPEEPEAPAEPAAEPEAEPAAEPAAEIEYAPLALNIKNKTGKTIDEVYIYPAGGDRGASVVEKGWPDKDMDGDRYELNIFIARPAGALMEVFVVFGDGETATWVLDRPLEMYDKLSMKKGTDVSKWEHEPNDDADDMAKMDAVLAAGVTADGFYPGAAAEPEAEPAAEAAAEIEYASLALNIKNKTGKTIDEVYIYPAGGDRGASVVEKGWPDKDADGDRYELNIFIIRPAGALMEVCAVFEDGETAVWQLDRTLEMYDKLSMKKGTDVSKWEHEPNDDVDDMAKMDAVLAAGVTADGWYPAE